MKNSTLKTALLSFLFVTATLVTSQQALAFEDWTKSIEAGYNTSNGNTKKSSLNLTGALGKKWDQSEFSNVFNFNYGSDNGSMNAQNWDNISKYSQNFGQDYRWFRNFLLTIDHDRFANVDYRITPAAGVGYWIAREDDWKWSADLNLGYEITEYRDGTKDKSDLVLIGHTYAEKKVFDNGILSEDFTIIPSLEGNGFRVKSITAFTNKISDNLDFSIKYILDHDSEPSPGTKKTDTQLISGVKYAF